MCNDKTIVTMVIRESWRRVDIEGFEHYVVSTMGKVINTKTGKILKPISRYRKSNTQFVRLTNGEKMYQVSVHILVAKTFIDNPENFDHVIHLDGDGSNNVVYNLKWCSHSECIRHWQKFGINKRGLCKNRRKRVKCVETGAHYTSMAEAGRTLGLDPSSISKQVRGIYAQVKGYHFELI